MKKKEKNLDNLNIIYYNPLIPSILVTNNLGKFFKVKEDCKFPNLDISKGSTLYRIAENKEYSEYKILYNKFEKSISFEHNTYSRKPT